MMQDFAGANRIFIVNCPLMKRALVAILALAGLGLTLPQNTRAGDFDPIFGFYRPELFTTLDSTSLVRDLSMPQFLDGRLPGSTQLGRMGSARIADFDMSSSAGNSAPRHRAIAGPVKDPKDGKEYSSSESFAAEKASLNWTGGEIGFFYGHSASGHVSGDEFGSYIMGGVGNEHMQINVGASYDEFHYSRSRH